jgi:hypothetical protein
VALGHDFLVYFLSGHDNSDVSCNIVEHESPSHYTLGLECLYHWRIGVYVIGVVLFRFSFRLQGSLYQNGLALSTGLPGGFDD